MQCVLCLHQYCDDVLQRCHHQLQEVGQLLQELGVEGLVVPLGQETRLSQLPDLLRLLRMLQGVLHVVVVQELVPALVDQVERVLEQAEQGLQRSEDVLRHKASLRHGMGEEEGRG